jgi:hypothetical protein
MIVFMFSSTWVKIVRSKLGQGSKNPSNTEMNFGYLLAKGLRSPQLPVVNYFDNCFWK